MSRLLLLLLDVVPVIFSLCVMALPLTFGEREQTCKISPNLPVAEKKKAFRVENSSPRLSFLKHCCCQREFSTIPEESSPPSSSFKTCSSLLSDSNRAKWWEGRIKSWPVMPKELGNGMAGMCLNQQLLRLTYSSSSSPSPLCFSSSSSHPARSLLRSLSRQGESVRSSRFHFPQDKK